MIEPRSTIMVVKQHNQRQRAERAIVLQCILDRQVSPLAILNPSSKCSIRTHVNKSKKRPSLIPSLRPHRLLVSLPSNSSTRGRLTLCSTDSKTNTKRYQLRNPTASNNPKTVSKLNIKHKAATSLWVSHYRTIMCHRYLTHTNNGVVAHRIQYHHQSQLLNHNSSSRKTSTLQQTLAKPILLRPKWAKNLQSLKTVSPLSLLLNLTTRILLQTNDIIAAKNNRLLRPAPSITLIKWVLVLQTMLSSREKFDQRHGHKRWITISKVVAVNRRTAMQLVSKDHITTKVVMLLIVITMQRPVVT